MAKFTLNLDGPLLKLPKSAVGTSFDYAGRYQLTGEILVRYFADKKNGLPNKVLDVGGRGGFLGDLIKAPVTILDSEAEADTGDTQDDGAHMKTVADGEYEAVVTCDTLEHIPRSDRKSFINELVRTSSDLVVLAAPFADHGAAAEEAALQKDYKGFAGHEHRWLAEHKDFELPTEKEIMSYFAAHKLSVIKVNHSTIELWRTLMTINLLSNDMPEASIHEASAAINRLYAKELLFGDFTPDSYRTYFVASKKKELAYTQTTPSIQASHAIALTQLIGDFYGQLARFSDKTPASHAKIEKVSAERHDAQTKLMEMTDKYYGIVNSKTWRYTQPLRQINKLRYGSRDDISPEDRGDKV